VQVLREGASAIYGADALAGVINIVLLRRADMKPDADGRAELSAPIDPVARKAEMKVTISSRSLSRLVAALILGGAFVISANAGNCENPRDHAQRVACEKAKEGPDGLRHFR
jgi:hypothetical protein